MNKFRSFLYRLARILGDVNSVSQSVKQGSPMPMVKRFVRKKSYSGFASIFERLLR